MKKNNDHEIGGIKVDLTKPMPQRKPNKTMTGGQLLNKAMTGSHKLKTPNQKKEQELNKILNGRAKTSK